MNAFRRLNRQKYNILLSFILNDYQYYFFLQSKWNEIGCRILFSRLFLGLAGLHCSRPPQLHLLKEKKRKSNFSSFKSSFIFRSFVLRSLQDISTSEILTHKSNRHYKFCSSYIYWSASNAEQTKKSTRFQNPGLECKDFKIWYNLMAH